MASLCSMMTLLLPPKRYMVTIALRVPACRQPSRHRWHASRPSRVGMRTHTQEITKNGKQTAKYTKISLIMKCPDFKVERFRAYISCLLRCPNQLGCITSDLPNLNNPPVRGSEFGIDLHRKEGEKIIAQHIHTTYAHK